tara:strand:+ start:340 stop:651 length:312 start_codon:yes stop_codon:yes gene_type:complete
MPINLVVKEADPKTKKRFTAIFRIHKGGKVIKITHFGQRNPKKGTYIDHGDKKLRTAFRARHKSDLDTKDFKRAGYLSYFLLWGDKKTLKENLKDYKKKFNLD